MAERERPLILSDPMVRAVLAGTKTQTRRAVKLRKFQPSTTPGYDWIFRDRRGCRAAFCPYGRPGDRLWVREAWADAMSDGGPVICYRADLDRRYLSFDAWPIEYERYPGCQFANRASVLESGVEGRWRPSIDMPRWASRLTLEITGVRVERLQRITEADAVAEGVNDSANYTARAHYARLWDSLNGTKPGRDWASNPWVWALSFRRLDP